MIDYFSILKYFFVLSFMVIDVRAHEINLAKDIEVLEAKGLSGDVKSSVELASYYSLKRYNYHKKQFWNAKSIENGSLYSMLFFSASETRRNNINTVKAKKYLQFLSSIGFIPSKDFLLEYCDYHQDCFISKFYSLVDLSIRDSREYKGRLICYVSENIKIYTKEELAIILVIYKDGNTVYNIDESACGEKFFSEDVLGYIKANHNANLVISITKWLKFIREKPHAVTEEQEIFLYDMDQNNKSTETLLEKTGASKN